MGSSVRRIAVDAIKFPNFRRVRPIARLALFINIVWKRLDLVDFGDCGQSNAGRHGAKQVAAAQRRSPRFIQADPPIEQSLPRLALKSRSTPGSRDRRISDHSARVQPLQLNWRRVRSDTVESRASRVGARLTSNRRGRCAYSAHRRRPSISPEAAVPSFFAVALMPRRPYF
jgi:hypothetical protein